ncbi:hypothetical protein ABKV19_026835 [Rosa sericea]
MNSATLSDETISPAFLGDLLIIFFPSFAELLGGFADTEKIRKRRTWEERKEKNLRGDRGVVEIVIHFEAYGFSERYSF